LSRVAAISSQLPNGCLNQVDLLRSPKAAPLREKFAKLFHDLRPHFITAFADARPDGDYKVLDPATKSIRHGAYCFRQDLLGRAPPAGVHSRDGSVGRIGDQDGQAVGGSNRQRYPRCVRDQGVALAQFARLFSKNYFLGMNLTEGSKTLAGWPIGTSTGTEAVFQPRELIEHFGPIDLASQSKQSSL